MAKTLPSLLVLLAFAVCQCPAQLPAASPPHEAIPETSAPVPHIAVNVLGSVNYPARVNLPLNATLLDAIAATGGISRLGNAGKVVLIHKSKGDKPDREIINVHKIMQGEAKDIDLRDGDTVVVSESIF
jgi:protein involved in polysaccharide export with SLBB domain